MSGKTQTKVETIAAAKDKSVEIKEKCERWFIKHYFQTPEINRAKASADPADSLRKCAVESRRGTGKDDIYVETLAGGKIAFYIKPDTFSTTGPTAIFNVRQLTKMMAETFATAAPPETEEIFSEDKIFRLYLDNIVPSPFELQARRRAKFKTEEIESLGKSIVRHKLKQPIEVRPIRHLLHSDRTRPRMYEIVFGERRWLASKSAKLPTIKCFINDYTDEEVIELQYEENHKQQTNDPLDDAFYFQYLQQTKGYSEEDLADRLSTTLQKVRDKLKLNDLIEAAKDELSSGKLPEKHAFYLAKYPADTQKEIVRLQLAYKYQDRDEKAVSYEIFKEEVESEIVRRLADAPFPTDDPRLHIKHLLCRDCSSNSAFTTYLFP